VRHPSSHIFDFTPDTLRAWATARGLPNAIPVAEHWHLLKNASAAFLAAVQRGMPAV
jgi:hypothetical protein